MDYARFNYVAQPEDNISPKGIYPRIGDYDKWAINFGYRYFGHNNAPYQEEKKLNKLVTDTLTKHPELWFGGEGKDEDPRSQTEDLGDDAVAASDYGIKNLKRVVPNLIAWTKEDGDHYDNLAELHKEVLKQYSRYLLHVQKNIGTRYVTSRSSDEAGVVYQEIPKAKTKRAVDYICRQLFEPPLWLFPKDISALIDVKPIDFLTDNQANALNVLLSPGMLFNLANKATHSDDPYPVREYFADLLPKVWKKPSGNDEQQAYNRGLQRAYIEKLGMMINPKDIADGKAMNNIQRSDVRLEAIEHIKNVREAITTMLPQAVGLNKLHFEDMLVQIDKILKKTTTNS